MVRRVRHGLARLPSVDDNRVSQIFRSVDLLQLKDACVASEQHILLNYQEGKRLHFRLTKPSIRNNVKSHSDDTCIHVYA